MIESQLNRLLNLVGSDRGFFVLATQSFIEKVMKERFPHFDHNFRHASFKDNLYSFREYLKMQSGGYLKQYDVFSRIARQRSLTDEVRHSFGDAGQEDVETATFNLIQFCQVLGEEHELLNKFEENLDSWKNKSSVVELSSQLSKVKFELLMSKRERRQTLEKLRELEDAEQDQRMMEAKIAALDEELAQMKRHSDQRKERIDDLRKERNDWKIRKQQVDRQLEGLSREQAYLRNILHMTLYTRTRLDYERSLVHMTPEQRRVLESISLKNDFLIKGGAGTGKTLVLLEALKRVNQGVLDLGRKKILLLTFTKTLVKYSRYLSEIMEMTGGAEGIRTSDSFLNGLFGELFTERMDYHLLKELLKDRKHSLLTSRQLLVEIQDFIYAAGISREEYIDGMIPRKGLKVPLNREKREELWSIKEEAEADMDRRGVLCKGRARLKTLEKLQQDREGDWERPDYIFLDESQDLTAVELRILKLLCGTALILAGDTDQSIYGFQTPYARAGLELSGRTRILRQNYRNSLPIHLLAETFRRAGVEPSDGEIAPEAFREGPDPELYTADHTEELYGLLAEKVRIYRDSVDYDPENICVLAPNSFLQKIKTSLEEQGIPAVEIKDQGFDFSEKGSVRICTLHSSKGLDLPVTLLFIPRLDYPAGLSTEQGEKQLRNLLYVAMTRAMEHLNIFTKEESGDGLLEELKGYMEGV